jgi:hypothetical protein
MVCLPRNDPMRALILRGSEMYMSHWVSNACCAVVLSVKAQEVGVGGHKAIPKMHESQLP